MKGIIEMKRDQDKGRNQSGRWLMWAVFAMTMLFLQAPHAAAQWTTTGNDISNTNTGNVGIGTTSPTYKLQTVGKVKLGDTGSAPDQTSTVDIMDGSQTYALRVWDDNNLTTPRFAVKRTGEIHFNGGNVGIGTTGPSYPLDIVSPGAVALRVKGYSPTNNVQIRFRGGSTNVDQWAVGNAVATDDVTRNFDIYDLVANVNRLRVDSSGNVGIGTTNPTAKLDVNGDINVSGNINAKFQDIAEWVPATHALPAGTVVTLNPAQSNQVTASSTAYDTRVAGVISERPGLALGEAGKDKVLVATTGRVKVKVDASRSPIHIGDLLVTSDKEGVAMKSEPLMIQGRPFHTPGTLIGKALESLEKGTGEILVLLSLQ